MTHIRKVILCTVCASMPLLAQIKVIAHRGLIDGDYPENTLPAIMHACQSNVWGIEYDVRQTADKKLVICHNPSIKTSNGVEEVIHEQPLEQLLKINFGKGESDARIPQFFEVFDLCLASGKMQIIEIKDGAETKKEDKKYGTHLAAGMEVCNVVVSKIKEVHAEQTTRIASFSIPILLYVKNAYDGIHTHLFIGERNIKDFIENGKVKVKRGSDEEACLAAVQSVGVKLEYLTNKSVVDDFHKLGLSVDAWGVTTEEEYKKAKDLGVDSVTVEDSAILR